MTYDLMKRTAQEDDLAHWHEVYVEWDKTFMDTAIEDIPMEWFADEFKLRTQERKVRLTLYVDETVARAFKKHMNWQEIMRGVLRAYVRAKQDKLLTHSKDYYRAWSEWNHARREKLWAKKKRELEAKE